MMRLQTCILVFILVLSLPVLATAEKITLVADDWCPYNCQPQSDTPGFMIEIAKAILQKPGDEVEYTIMPYEESVEAVRQGKFTAVVGVARDEAPDLVYPREPMGETNEMFFTKKDFSWKYTDVASLEKVRVGIIEGYSYGPALDDYFEENIDNPKVVMAGGDTPLGDNIKRLNAGEIDVLLENPYVFHYYFASKGQKDQLAEYAEIQAPLQPDYLYLAFSPKLPQSAKYAEAVTAGMAELRQNGKLSDILTKYGVSDWMR